MRPTLLFVTVAALSGCTVVNAVSLPAVPGQPGQDVFVTAGDISTPHEVLGLVQVHRGGVLLFGNIDVIGTDLEAGFKETLLPEVRRRRGARAFPDDAVHALGPRARRAVLLRAAPL
ncbi:MAG: hypothetical protein INH41_01955 [Myxococcaceae bacterium]|nr:hypothetical protein [Myxococcaceae bacterium]